MVYLRAVVIGTGVILLSGAVGSVLGYLMRVTLANNLSPTEFGLFYAVYALVSLLASFRGLGTGLAAIQATARASINDDSFSIRKIFWSFFTIQTTVYIMCAVILALLSGVLAENYFHAAVARPLLLVLLVGFFFSTLESCFLALFQGMRATKSFAFINLYRSAAALLLTSLFIHQLGVLAPAYAYAFVLMTGPVFYFIFARKLINRLWAFAFNRATSYQLLRFGLPTAVSSIAVSAISYVDTLIITAFQPLSQVALYTVALPTANVLRNLPKSLSVLIFPVSAELYVKDARAFVIGIKNLQRLLFVAIIPVALCLFVYAQTVLDLFFGSEYTAAETVLKVLTLSVIFGAVSLVNSYVLLGVGKTKQFASINTFGAIMATVLNFALVPAFSILGASISNLVSSVFMFGLSSMFIKKIIDTPIPFITWGKTLIAGGAFICVSYILNHWLALPLVLEIGLVLAISLCVYGSVLLALRVVTIDELKKLIAKVVSKKISPE